MDKKFVVYIIRNGANDNVYIGQTDNLERRKKQHLYQAKSGKKNNKLYNSMRKNKPENFTFSVIFSTSIHQEALDMEILKIREYDSFKTGLNMTEGGEGSVGWKHTEKTKTNMCTKRKGGKHTEETKSKISDKHKGKKLTDEHKFKLSKSHKGKKLTDEHRANISTNMRGISKSEEAKTNMRGKKLTEEHKTKIGAKHKGKKLTEETKAKYRDAAQKHPVSQYDLLTGELISSYPSASEAERATGVHQSNIGKCCNGKYKQAGGYFWKYTIKITSP